MSPSNLTICERAEAVAKRMTYRLMAEDQKHRKWAYELLKVIKEFEPAIGWLTPLQIYDHVTLTFCDRAVFEVDDGMTDIRDVPIPWNRSIEWFVSKFGEDGIRLVRQKLLERLETMEKELPDA